MAPGAVEGMSERTTFATTTLCTLAIPLAVAMNRPVLAGSLAPATAVTVYVNPETTAAPPSARLTPPGWRRRAREGRRHVRGTSCAPTVTTVTAGAVQPAASWDATAPCY